VTPLPFIWRQLYLRLLVVVSVISRIKQIQSQVGDEPMKQIIEYSLSAR
jgi:hypothetical protein